MRYLILGVALAFIGCSSSDEDTSKTGTDAGSGGSGGSGGGSGGTSTGGSAGSSTGGSAGASSGCPSDIGSADGQPCSEEGKSCGNCSDPCQFCNIIQCQGGVWKHMEVFPGECDGG